MQITYPLTIYYDASCPMCKSEMETIKESDANDKLILVDCSDNSLSVPTSCPVTREAMMERIHAIDAKGVWIKSVDVFAVAYEASGYKTISKFWASKTLKPILTRLYPLVADNRHWLSKTPMPYWYNDFLKYLSKK